MILPEKKINFMTLPSMKTNFQNNLFDVIIFKSYSKIILMNFMQPSTSISKMKMCKDSIIM